MRTVKEEKEDIIMTATLALIATIIGGVTGLLAGLKHHLAGINLIFAVAGSILAAIILTYVAILALKVLVVAAVIVGIYYAVQWIRSLW